ncbi:MULTISPECIES: LLM class F420-dependent oxidoreductase [unclassified Microbispora]|uniref:LLM class F420-dependent oxidoreductase n=1 Tax=unclassified Microbispora TaxID=2614687 RepID=UPI001C729A1E|nr:MULTISPECIES: LLM class F420-dependent oxidoreductase [unclassified Microbispora]
MSTPRAASGDAGVSGGAGAGPPAGAVRWGVTLPLAGLGLHRHREIVEALPSLGYGDVWTGEGGGYDGLTALTAALAWSPGLRAGTGVLPAQTRGPGVLAQTAASMAELGQAEVLLGIGSSVPAHVTALNGRPHGRPYAHVRDLLRFLRRAFDGEHVVETYETFSIDFELRRRPPVRPKVIVGALRPGMLKLAFTEGDGAITNVLAAHEVPRIVEAAGPPAEGQELVVKIFVTPTDDAAYARAAGRAFLGWILNQPPYRAFHDWLGRGDALAASRAAWDAGDRRGAAEALPDSVVDELWVHGSPEECRAHIARYLHPGVTAVELHVTPSPELDAAPGALPEVLAALRVPDDHAASPGRS